MPRDGVLVAEAERGKTSKHTLVALFGRGERPQTGAFRPSNEDDALARTIGHPLAKLSEVIHDVSFFGLGLPGEPVKVHLGVQALNVVPPRRHRLRNGDRPSAPAANAGHEEHLLVQRRRGRGMMMKLLLLAANDGSVVSRFSALP